MMIRIKHSFFVVLLLTIIILRASESNAQNANSITVSGEVLTPLILNKEDFAGYRQVLHKVKDKDGKEHAYTCVMLIEILEKAGMTTGAKLRGENLAKFILVQAADGYEVVYSLPEVDPEFTSNMVLLAIEKDGEPLPGGEGPFRLIAPQDKKQARWIREIRSIKVLFAKD